MGIALCSGVVLRLGKTYGLVVRAWAKVCRLLSGLASDSKPCRRNGSGCTVTQNSADSSVDNTTRMCIYVYIYIIYIYIYMCRFAYLNVKIGQTPHNSIMVMVLSGFL